MSKLLLAKPLIESRKAELKATCDELIKKGITPHLKVFLVGKDPASIIYTRNKKIFCESIGAKCNIINLDEGIAADDFLSQVRQATQDSNVHGCLIQLPVPSQLKHLDLSSLVPPSMDVDGFHKDNLMKILEGDKGEKALCPCTPRGILQLIQYYNLPLAGANITVVGRSMIVGKPLSMLLTNYDATVTLCHSKTKELKAHCDKADIIVLAVGKAKFFNSSFLNKGHAPVIIDVGMNRDENGKLCGDANFDDLFQKVSAITPVPGGVGPLTILSLAENLMQSAMYKNTGKIE